ncbi:MAG: CDP-diacylglycerol--glycerol-3-phosphate 3-phosphatidyltransferase [Chloroflexi bacterium]|nr:CDP-diacylglycerol--glycerol-3-phosphate 3-phosphatidyltransferase [Chloroflexota bacterium]
MANIITLFRFPLLFLYIGLLYFGDAQVQAWCVPFIVIIILMDTLDGVVARSRNETSLLGSVLDIATDRTLELVLWVIFADLNLISILVPVIVITRGITVDAVRAIGMRKGKKAFEQLKSPLSQFLVSSRFMRASYGIVKGFAFGTLTLNLSLRSAQAAWEGPIHAAALTFTWLSVLICLLRGIPVLIEGYIVLSEKK